MRLIMVPGTIMKCIIDRKLIKFVPVRMGLQRSVPVPVHNCAFTKEVFFRLFNTSTVYKLPDSSENSATVLLEKRHETLGRSEEVETDELLKEISNALSNYPDLSNFSAGGLKRTLSCLHLLGFSVDEGVLMISQCKDIIGLSESKYFETMSGLRQCKFNGEEIKSIIKSAPEYLLINPQHVVSRYITLRQQFSHKSLKTLFSNCPKITLMKWEVITEKIEYLKNVMYAPNNQIIDSQALVCPLHVIKTRHVFLERAGLFKTPNPKSNVPSNNPSLSKIIDTPDEYFAEMVAGLTTEEYLTFLDMFASEETENSENEGSDVE